MNATGWLPQSATGERIEAIGPHVPMEGRKEKLAAAGGILAGLGMAACCVAPFALFMLGVSGAWIGNLTALRQYQPIFVVLGGASIGYGFYLVYRKPRAVCEDGSCCASPRSFRMTKIGLWAATVMVVVALLSVDAGLAAEKTVTLAVENMSCESCPYIVRQSLLRVSGVATVVVSFEDKTATVTFDDAATGIQSLISATTNAGYPSQSAN